MRLGTRYTSGWGLALALLLGGCHREEAAPDPWTRVPVRNNATAIYAMDRVLFSSAQVGWISGGIDKGLMGNPVLLKTEDGGSSWRAIDLSGLQISRFVAFYPFSEQVLYACAPDASVTLPTIPRLVYKSRDGGESWQKLASTGFANGSWAFYFFDEQTGLSVNNAYVQRTTDGGQSWRTVYQSSGGYGAGLNQLQVFASGVGYAAGSTGGGQASVGTLLRTQDGGQSWQELAWPYGGITTLQFSSARAGYAGTLGGVLYRTQDGGTSWQQVGATPPNASRGVFVDAGRGYYASLYTSWQTGDGGSSWQQEHVLPTTDTYSALGFSPAGVGIATTNNGLILKR